MYIYFYYNSPNFRWSVASVIFWISSRVDIVIAKNVLSNDGIIRQPKQGAELHYFLCAR
jgi:hypothetical protein